MEKWKFRLDVSPVGDPQSLPDPLGYEFMGEAARKADDFSAMSSSVELTTGGDAGSEGVRPITLLQQEAQKNIQSKAWEITTGQAGSVMMSLFMLYFSGASSGIFTVLLLCYSISSAARSLFNVNTAFFGVESTGMAGNLIPQKIGYCLIWAAALGYMVHRAASMGLLPTRSGDYLSLIPERRYLSTSAAVFV